PDLAQAHRIRRARIAGLQRLYLIGVDHAMQAAEEMREASRASPRVVQRAIGDAEEVLRDLDRRHLARVHEVHAGFYADMRPHERDSVARHRAEIASVLDGSGAVVMTGGHIA